MSPLTERAEDIARYMRDVVNHFGHGTRATVGQVSELMGVDQRAVDGDMASLRGR
jgi:hypothetical protein